MKCMIFWRLIFDLVRDIPPFGKNHFGLARIVCPVTENHLQISDGRHPSGENRRMSGNNTAFAVRLCFWHTVHRRQPIYPAACHTGCCLYAPLRVTSCGFFYANNSTRYPFVKRRKKLLIKTERQTIVHRCIDQRLQRRIFDMEKFSRAEDRIFLTGTAKKQPREKGRCLVFSGLFFFDIM